MLIVYCKLVFSLFFHKASIDLTRIVEEKSCTTTFCVTCTGSLRIIPAKSLFYRKVTIHIYIYTFKSLRFSKKLQRISSKRREKRDTRNTRVERVERSSILENSRRSNSNFCAATIHLYIQISRQLQLELIPRVLAASSIVFESRGIRNESIMVPRRAEKNCLSCSVNYSIPVESGARRGGEDWVGLEEGESFGRFDPCGYFKGVIQIREERGSPSFLFVREQRLRSLFPFYFFFLFFFTTLQASSSLIVFEVWFARRPPP